MRALPAACGVRCRALQDDLRAAAARAASQRLRRAASAARASRAAAPAAAAHTPQHRSARNTAMAAPPHAALSATAASAGDDDALPLPRPMRLYAISDLHTDFPANMAWIEAISTREYRHDALIVAGDVSDDLAVVEETLRALQARFAIVFFTPGNHELWCLRKASTPAADSFAKLADVLALCARLGVRTQPALIGASDADSPAGRATPVWVVPFLSWHHASFDTEPDLTCIDVPPVHRMMTDFAACKWPEGVDQRTDDVARLIDAQNAALPAALTAAPRGQRPHAVVSFSHFLPRLELCPEKRFLFFPNLPKAAGSAFLRARLDALAPDIHVFGHLHFGWDATLDDGVRYVQAALAYPSERETRMGTLRVGGSVEAGAPLLVFDCAGDGAAAPQHSARWSDYYQEARREPDSQVLPSWVAQRYARRGAATMGGGK